MLSYVAVWFAATRNKRGLTMLGAFMALVVLFVLVWNLVP